MTVKYTPEDRSDIEGILMSALSDSFRDRYIDLLSAYCRIAGDDFCLYTADIHSCNVDQNVLTRESVNLYAVKVQPEMRLGGYTLGLSSFEEVFELEGYDEVWVDNTKVLVWTDTGWYAAN